MQQRRMEKLNFLWFHMNFMNLESHNHSACVYFF